MEMTTSSAQQGSNKQRDFDKQPFEKFAKITLPQLEAELQKRLKELMELSNTLKTVIETVGRILLAAEPHFPKKHYFKVCKRDDREDSFVFGRPHGRGT